MAALSVLSIVSLCFQRILLTMGKEGKPAQGSRKTNPINDVIYEETIRKELRVFCLKEDYVFSPSFMKSNEFP